MLLILGIEMDPSLVTKYDLRLPRYTSYPASPHFSESVTPATYGTWLGCLDPAVPLSLYLHIVYCAEMCWFCGCHTKITKRYEPVAEYVDTLLREIDLVADHLPGLFSTQHIHFGGGTPTIVSSDDFVRILHTLRDRFSLKPEAEIAVEIDPRTVNEEYLAHLAHAGVNRVSLGVQDFNATVQQAVNRVHPFEQVASVFKWLRRHDIHRINMDLMYGLPHQTQDSLLATVDDAVSLRPCRIVLFGYAHVPWMRKHQTLIPETSLPNIEERWNLYESAGRRLIEHGYVRIGLDHFARADDEMAVALTKRRLHRNFQGYTTDNASVLLGMGASGIGHLPQGYVANVRSVSGWKRSVLNNILPIERGFCVSEEDRLRRQVINALMCNLEVDLQKEASSLGYTADHFRHELNAVEDLIRDGLVTRNGTVLRMTEQGRPLVRAVAACFDQYLKTNEQRHSKAV